MGNHGGSIGSQHQIQGGLGQSQIMGSGSGQNLMSESYQQGILKKSPYCPIDKDRWDERMSSSSQNNLVNLTSGQSTMATPPWTPPPSSRRSSRGTWPRPGRSVNTGANKNCDNKLGIDRRNWRERALSMH